MKALRRWYWQFRIWRELAAERAYARTLREYERDATKKRRLLRKAP